MNIEPLYRSAAGRFLVVLMQKLGVFRLISRFLKSPLSRKIIPHFIEKYQVDMEPFEGQKYRSFAEFFRREKEMPPHESSPEALISPVDGLLSVYHISDDLIIPMKGSYYRVKDMVWDAKMAEQYRDGLCLVFRLQAMDYHHFCSFDTANLKETHFLPGRLHAVQPIACEKVPVFRLNRRWGSLLETENFETAIQVAVGAMMVGGVTFAKPFGRFKRGDDMGNFELAGSTVILLFNASVKKRLRLFEQFRPAMGGAAEVPVTMGRELGTLSCEAVE